LSPREHLPPIPDAFGLTPEDPTKKKKNRKRGKRKNKKGPGSRDKSESNDGEWLVAEKKPQKMTRNRSWLGFNTDYKWDKKETL
jgi:hypothetical protein